MSPPTYPKGLLCRARRFEAGAVGSFPKAPAVIYPVNPPLAALDPFVERPTHHFTYYQNSFPMGGHGNGQTNKILHKASAWGSHGKRRHRFEIQRILASFRRTKTRGTEKRYSSVMELFGADKRRKRSL